MTFRLISRGRAFNLFQYLGIMYGRGGANARISKEAARLKGASRVASSGRRTNLVGALGLILGGFLLSACNNTSGPLLPPAPISLSLPGPEYEIGPGDTLNIFVWRNPELSVDAPVRPDGRISIPLAEDIVAVGKTPTALAREVEDRLSKYVTNPIVTVIPKSFIGPFAQQVRVVGEAITPRALPYRANMTVLDALIEVGGLTKYAAGNRAVLVRTVNNVQETYPLHLKDLMTGGDVQANVGLEPGDIVIIPQSYF